MFKKLLLLCCVLSVLLVPAASAEETAPYIPGRATQTLFAEAFARGDMLLANMSFDLSLNENAASMFEADAALLDALSEAIGNSALTLGLGRIEDGLRLLLVGTYAADEGQAVLDLQLDLTAQGLSAMSSLLPGERFTARWDTLLTLAGLSPEEAAQILSLHELDLEPVIEEFAAQAEDALELISRIAAPYGETILSHIAALPLQVQTDVPAESGFPAAASEIRVTITSKAVGDLLIALSDQLQADTTLCAFIDSALAESGEDVTTAELCQAMREFAGESLTDESLPLHIYIGMDDAGSLIYFNAVLENEAGESILLAVIAAPDEEAPEATYFTLNLLALTAEDEITDGLSFVAAYPTTPTSGALDVQVYLEIYADSETVFATELTLSDMAVLSEDALRGREGAYMLNIAADDGYDALSMSFFAAATQSETADGGEQSTLGGTLDVTVNDTQLPMTFDAYSLAWPTETGPIASLTSFFRAPMLGLEEYTESYTLYTAAYAPDLSAVTDVQLETASAEALNALAERAMNALQETLTTLATLLPQALTSAL